MSNDARPVLSIIIRRFDHDMKDQIMQSVRQLQEVASDQTGYLGHHNSLSKQADFYELVNIFTFNSRKNLEKWEKSDRRKTCLAELDRHPQVATKHTQFDELAELLHPVSRISKIEIVVILMFWILVLGAILNGIADLLLPVGFSSVGRSVLVVAVNVLLISYIFLPWSSNRLTSLKTRFAEYRSRK